MTDATCTTWFGTENVYVHLINFMPITAITAELFNKGNRAQNFRIQPLAL